MGKDKVKKDIMPPPEKKFTAPAKGIDLTKIGPSPSAPREYGI